MQIRALSVPDAFEITPQQHSDDRGLFLEWYRFDRLADVVGHPLELKQGSVSVSHRGVVRGIHFADVPSGQAKYVTVTAGAGVDYVVDLRVGSPTFGSWDSVVLDTNDRRAVYVAEGLGHAFVSVADGTTLSYLLSDVYRPEREREVNPLDSDIGLAFPAEAGPLRLSSKDLAAPGLAEAAAAGILPTWEAAQEQYADLAARS